MTGVSTSPRSARCARTASRSAPTGVVPDGLWLSVDGADALDPPRHAGRRPGIRPAGRRRQRTPGRSRGLRARHPRRDLGVDAAALPGRGGDAPLVGPGLPLAQHGALRRGDAARARAHPVRDRLRQVGSLQRAGGGAAARGRDPRDEAEGPRSMDADARHPVDDALRPRARRRREREDRRRGGDRLARRRSARRCPSRGPPEGQGTVAQRGGRPVAVSTTGGRTRAVSAVCTHLGGVLSWNDAECTWDCPLHGSRFAPDGTRIEGPADRDLPTAAPRPPGD